MANQKNDVDYVAPTFAVEKYGASLWRHSGPVAIADCPRSQVRQAFDYAFSQLSRAVRAGSAQAVTALSRIVQVDQVTIEYRSWVRAAFPVTHITIGTISCNISKASLNYTKIKNC